MFFFSTASSPIIIPLDSDEEEYFSEYEYLDPYEGEGPYSSTPPPPCDTESHEVCVPPAWGEEIPGSLVRCRCLLCHEDDKHHAIRCIRCGNAPGCCVCIWGYMRSRYNSGCPLCRAGDPDGENPLGADQRRIMPRDRHSVVVYRRGRGGRRGSRGGRGRGEVGRTLVCGIGRGAGRGRPQEGERRRRRRKKKQQKNKRKGHDHRRRERRREEVRRERREDRSEKRPMKTKRL